MSTLNIIISNITQSTSSSTLKDPVSSTLPPLQFDFPLDLQPVAETKAMATNGWSPEAPALPPS
jgi:hypothetical protein